MCGRYELNATLKHELLCCDVYHNGTGRAMARSESGMIDASMALASAASFVDLATCA